MRIKMNVKKISLLIGALFMIGPITLEPLGLMPKLVAFAMFHAGLTVLIVAAFVSAAHKLKGHQTRKGEQ